MGLINKIKTSWVAVKINPCLSRYERVILNELSLASKTLGPEKSLKKIQTYQRMNEYEVHISNLKGMLRMYDGEYKDTFRKRLESIQEINKMEWGYILH